MLIFKSMPVTIWVNKIPQGSPIKLLTNGCNMRSLELLSNVVQKHARFAHTRVSNYDQFQQVVKCLILPYGHWWRMIIIKMFYKII